MYNLNAMYFTLHKRHPMHTIYKRKSDIKYVLLTFAQDNSNVKTES